MRKCPRCESAVRPLLVGGLDLTSRTAFGVSIALGFLVLEALLVFSHSKGLELSGEYVPRIALSAAARFALASRLLWPHAVHAEHARPRGWREGVALALGIPALWFMNPLIVAPLLRLCFSTR